MIVLFLFFVIALVLIYFSNIWNIHKIFIFIVVAISVLSFFYLPPETADLYRHYETIEFYGEMGLKWVLENQCDINPLTSLLLYIFSFLDEPRFYASFTTIITYGFSFMLLYKVSMFYSLTKNSILLLSAFILINYNYLMTVSNNRIFMLYAIVSYFFYMDFIEERFHKTAFCVYILSVFFHYGIILVVVPRLFMYFYKPASKRVYFYFLVLLILFIYKGELILQSFWLDLVADKVDGYKHYTTFGILQYSNSLFCIITCCTCIILGKYPIYQNSKYQILFWLILSILLFNSTNYQVVYRGSNLITSLSIVPFAQMMYDDTKQELLKIVLAIQCVITLAYYLFYEYQFVDFKFVI